jgi:hypothetical protein
MSEKKMFEQKMFEQKIVELKQIKQKSIKMKMIDNKRVEVELRSNSINHFDWFFFIFYVELAGFYEQITAKYSYLSYSYLIRVTYILDQGQSIWSKYLLILIAIVHNFDGITRMELSYYCLVRC